MRGASVAALKILDEQRSRFDGIAWHRVRRVNKPSLRSIGHIVSIIVFSATIRAKSTTHDRLMNLFVGA
jgi:hypothetical protein